MTNDRTFFDCHSIVESMTESALPQNACGVVSFGGSGEHHSSQWRAGTLSCIVGPNDPRYPHGADVLDLCMDDATLVRHLKEPPSHWWPLCGSGRANGKPLIIHLNADDFGSLAKGVSRLARAFPAVRLVADPFMNGKAARWQAGVCLADEPNVWITTRGLYAAPRVWPDRSEREALHFTIGEVGAGKLLFASGMTPTQVNAQPTPPAEWLMGIPFLEAAQRDLILRKNAMDAFAGVAV